MIMESIGVQEEKLDKKYGDMSREELIEACEKKDNAFQEWVLQMQRTSDTLYGKKDIMGLYKCESNKALRILKLLFQMGFGIKIGKEYYVSQVRHDDFINSFSGKEVFV